MSGLARRAELMSTAPSNLTVASTSLSLKRPRRDRESVKALLLEKSVIRTDLRFKCGCALSCVQNISEPQVWQIRSTLSEFSQQEELIWRTRKLEEYKTHSSFNLDSHRMCLKGWSMVVGGPSHIRTVYTTMKSLDGESCCDLKSSHEAKQMRSELNDITFSRDNMRLWIAEILSTHAEPHPETGVLQMDWFTVKEGYKLYTEEESQDMGSVWTPSLTEFRRAWNEVIDELKISIREQKTIGKCDECLRLHNLIRHTPNRSNEKRNLWDAIRKHKGEIREARSLYHQRRRLHDVRFCSMIIDGMDQAKTHVPYSYMEYLSQKELKACRLSQRIHGCLVHGVHGGKYIYVINPSVPKGSNQVVGILQDIIASLPHQVVRLSIQVDGCSENWNQYLIAFCCELVERRSFEEITLHRLPVGHTHEDIDQMFSVISRAFKTQQPILRTPTEFDTFLRQKVFCSGLERVFVRRLNTQFDIKQHYSTHLTDTVRGLGHPNPVHCFRFRMGAAGRPVIQFKAKEADPVWQPQSYSDNGIWVRDDTFAGWPSPLSDMPVLGQIPGSDAKSTEWETSSTKLFEKILSCANLFGGWDSSHTDEWINFQTNPSHFSYPLVWKMEELAARVAPPINPQSFSPSTPDLVCDRNGELFVCGSVDAVMAWQRDRAAQPITNPETRSTAELCAHLLTLKPNSIVCVEPDRASRLSDEAAGYCLPLSFGRITSVDSVGLCVTVVWQYADKFDSKFRDWGFDDQSLHIDTIHVLTLEAKKDGNPWSTTLLANKKLGVAAIQWLKESIGVLEYQKYCIQK